MRMTAALIVVAIIFALPNAGAYQGADSTSVRSLVIEGNDEFTAENGILGGSGTQSDPFLFETAYAFAYNIVIRNTSLHFRIGEITLTKNYSLPPTDDVFPGLILFNCSNGTVQGASQLGEVAFSIEKCKHISIRESALSLLVMNDSSDCVIERNWMSFIYDYTVPFRIGNSTGIEVVGNSMYGWARGGIAAWNCRDIDISRNAVVSAIPNLTLLRDGILLVDVSSSTVRGNLVEGFSCGIKLVSCEGVEVVDNRLSENLIEFQDDDGLNFYSEESSSIEWSREKSVALSIAILLEAAVILFALVRGRRGEHLFGSSRHGEGD